MEVKAKTGVVYWLGQYELLTVIICSERAAILLRDLLLELWCETGRVTKKNERTISVKVKDLQGVEPEYHLLIWPDIKE